MQAYPQVAIRQVLESCRFVRRHFVATMMRRHRSLTPVYISWSAAEQVSLHVIPLRLQQPIDGVRRGLAASGFLNIYNLWAAGPCLVCGSHFS